MAFDLAFDFRSTSGYVTDPAYGVFASREAYPYTYTNGNGDSINAGWDSQPQGQSDVDATNDVRIAGYVYHFGTIGVRTFTVDLSSGSAPGAGTYDVDIALGTADNPSLMVQDVLIKDNATTVIDLTNGGAGYTTAADHYIDATGTDINATGTWTGTPVAQAFASTTVNIVVTPNGLAAFTQIAHFRLTLQEEAGPIEGVLAVTLGALTTTATGVLPVAGAAAITFGGLTTVASGVLPVAGVAAITLEALVAAGTGTLAIEGAAAITLGALTLVATNVAPSAGLLMLRHHHHGL